jgi:hypothetical protein
LARLQSNWTLLDQSTREAEAMPPFVFAASAIRTLFGSAAMRTQWPPRCAVCAVIQK